MNNEDKFYSEINGVLFLDGEFNPEGFRCSVSDVKNGAILIDDNHPFGDVDQAFYSPNSFFTDSKTRMPLKLKIKTLYRACVLVTYQAVTDIGKTKEVAIPVETFSSYYKLIEEQEKRERKIDE